MLVWSSLCMCNKPNPKSLWTYQDTHTNSSLRSCTSFKCTKSNCITHVQLPIQNSLSVQSLAHKSISDFQARNNSRLLCMGAYPTFPDIWQPLRIPASVDTSGLPRHGAVESFCARTAACKARRHMNSPQACLDSDRQENTSGETWTVGHVKSRLAQSSQ